MTIAERRRQRLASLKLEQQEHFRETTTEMTKEEFNARYPDAHYYFGQHNTWIGEPLHECSCGFESHEKYQVEAHIKAEACAKEAERIEQSYLEMRADLHRGED